MAIEASPAIEEIKPIRERGQVPRKIWVGVSIVGFFVIVALVAPLIAPHDPIQQDLFNRLAPPSVEHPLGTDAVGRDVLSRLIFATRVDLRLAFLGALFPFLIGTLLGSMAGYFGRAVDMAVMRVVDVVQAFPVYVLVIALVFALGPGERSILVALAVIVWTVYARLIRGEILRIRTLDYVRAAWLGGLSHPRILARHVIPNVMGQSVVYFMSDVVLVILTVAAFSFLNLGIPEPTPEWGQMIAAGQPYIRTQWWLAAVPGMVIITAGVGLSLIADGLDDLLRSR